MLLCSAWEEGSNSVAIQKKKKRQDNPAIIRYTRKKNTSELPWTVWLQNRSYQQGQTRLTEEKTLYCLFMHGRAWAHTHTEFAVKAHSSIPKAPIVNVYQQRFGETRLPRHQRAKAAKQDPPLFLSHPQLPGRGRPVPWFISCRCLACSCGCMDNSMHV